MTLLRVFILALIGLMIMIEWFFPEEVDKDYGKDKNKP
jgi:hypothetical protein